MYSETVPGGQTILEELGGYIHVDAFDIVRDALISEGAQHANPFVNSKGFYENEFIKDHGGINNVTVEYTSDGKFKILKASRSLVPIDNPNYNNYKLVNSNPELNIIVVPN